MTITCIVINKVPTMRFHSFWKAFYENSGEHTWTLSLLHCRKPFCYAVDAGNMGETSSYATRIRVTFVTNTFFFRISIFVSIKKFFSCMRLKCRINFCLCIILNGTGRFMSIYCRGFFIKLIFKVYRSNN